MHEPLGGLRSTSHTLKRKSESLQRTRCLSLNFSEENYSYTGTDYPWILISRTETTYSCKVQVVSLSLGVVSCRILHPKKVLGRLSCGFICVDENMCLLWWQMKERGTDVYTMTGRTKFSYFPFVFVIGPRHSCCEETNLRIF